MTIEAIITAALLGSLCIGFIVGAIIAGVEPPMRPRAELPPPPGELAPVVHLVPRSPVVLEVVACGRPFDWDAEGCA